jgi:ribosome modulation factor
MSAHHLICKAFDKGWNAGFVDREKAECPFAPFTQEEKWSAWMIGYEEAYERYAITAGAGMGETTKIGSRRSPPEWAEGIAQPLSGSSPQGSKP